MNRRAQITVEVAVLICVVVAATIAIHAYVKRGIEGRMKEKVERVSGGELYEPGAFVGGSVATRSVNETRNSYSKFYNPDIPTEETPSLDTDIYNGKAVDDRVGYSDSSSTMNTTLNKWGGVLAPASEP